MSTVSKPPDPKSAATDVEPDPYRYGWRHVRTIRADGTEGVAEIPLTLEDVLHPEEGDYIVQTDPHDSDLAYLKAVFKSRLAKNLSAAVLSDCRVDWNIPGVRPLAPDIALFLGVRRHIGWSTFDVAKEHARPAMVIEVTSRDTRINDIGIKVDYYHRAGVSHYVIADVSEGKDGERQIDLIRYDYAPRRYKRGKPNRRGWIWLAPVQLWLGLTRDRQGGFFRLACFDPATEKEIEVLTTIGQEFAEIQAAARAAARAQKEAETRAADADAAKHLAQDRIRTLEAELEKLRGRQT